MSKLCLLFRPNAAWTDGTNLSLIDEVAMIKWVTWENYISQTSLVTYFFYSTFQVTIMWRTIEESFKKILRQLLLLRNHLKPFSLLLMYCQKNCDNHRHSFLSNVFFLEQWLVSLHTVDKADTVSEIMLLRLSVSTNGAQKTFMNRWKYTVNHYDTRRRNCLMNTSSKQLKRHYLHCDVITPYYYIY